ncbi:AFR628Cp [Eremothecium gossypii ATCC 10895]|uniref:AFR628Cp n=1 Tax=Eremothecium gossypii (strain ATCC 10895 / CBS 109.51 / FGSC 9923 / NRRL Y-1056) TaxID=284811 RepID=Q752E8_EREGS|nr:AFR628Cp [Eremothecium gossypii ATCC 10895]AAS53999.2 AFR628Cp [Eremothecium gossypii ATCC 10895]AEY98313.1 FAFR628Cp [Eremothecium gossypii FDAG1]
MKFSHSLKYNAVPEWQDHYLNYSGLKKLIYALQAEELQYISGSGERGSGNEKTVTKLKNIFRRGGRKQRDEECFELEDVHEKTHELRAQSKLSPETQSSISSDGTAFNPRDVFVARLVEERDLIDRFYKRLEIDLYKQQETLLKDLENAGATRPEQHAYHEAFEAHAQSGIATRVRTNDSVLSAVSRRLSVHEPNMSEDEDEDEEEYDDATAPHTALLNYADFNIKSQKRSILKKKIIDLYVELSQLKSYIELNRIGFFKITKKFDKTLSCTVRSDLIESGELFKETYVFQPSTFDNLDNNISQLVEFYAVITDNDDIEECRHELRSYLRDYIVWERNTVWKDMLGLESTANNIASGGKQDGDSADNIRQLEYFTYHLRKPIGVRNLVISQLKVPKCLFTLRALKLYVILALTLVLLNVKTFNDPAQKRCMALVECVALLWATEALPLFVTAMFVPLLVVLMQVLKDDKGEVLTAAAASSKVLSLMWSSTIMVLLAGFTLAAALSKYNIARVLASYLLTAAGTKPRNLLLVVMCVVFFLSMWISNVAAPVLTYSLINSVLRTMSSETPFAQALVLGVALAANIGGMASPISSPQNVISMDYLKEYNVGWGQFFAVSLPTCVISLALVWLLLIFTFKINTTTLKAYKPIKDGFTLKQYFIIAVSLATILLWCVLSRIEGTFGSAGQIAVIPLVLFFGSGLLSTQDINNFPWSIVILAMGGIALGGAVSSSGLLATIARSLQARVMDYSLYAVLVIFGLVMLVVGTFVSHTVSAIIIVPLVNEIGTHLPNPKASPVLVFGSALIASCGMGLASSGFPNVTAISMTDEIGNRYLSVNTFITRGVPASILAYLCVITIGFGIMNSVLSGVQPA